MFYTYTEDFFKKKKNTYLTGCFVECSFLERGKKQKNRQFRIITIWDFTIINTVHKDNAHGGSRWTSVLWQLCSYSLVSILAWCKWATARIIKCPDEYAAPGPDCSNRTLSVHWHAQHTLMGLLTVLCIHPTKTWDCASGDDLWLDMNAERLQIGTVKELQVWPKLRCPSSATYTVKLSLCRTPSCFRLTCCKLQYFGSEQQLQWIFYREWVWG